MPRVKIVVLIVELTPLAPKGEAGGVKQYISLVGLSVSDRFCVRLKRGEIWSRVYLNFSLTVGMIDYIIMIL